MAINAVLFDYGLVLSGPADAVVRRRMETLLGVDAESFGAAYWKLREAYDRGTLTAGGYWEAVAKEVGRPVDGATVAGLIEADVVHWGQPNAAMIAWAAALQRDGVKTGILSNLGDAMEAGLVKRLPWLAGFALKTFSHRVKMAKPDTAIYALAVEGLGVAPGEILFVDDREENIEAARRAGMAGIQYGNHAQFVEALRAMSFPHTLPVLEPSLFES